MFNLKTVTYKLKTIIYLTVVDGPVKQEKLNKVLLSCVKASL